MSILGSTLNIWAGWHSLFLTAMFIQSGNSLILKKTVLNLCTSIWSPTQAGNFKV